MQTDTDIYSSIPGLKVLKIFLFFIYLFKLMDSFVILIFCQLH